MNSLYWIVFCVLLTFLSLEAYIYYFQPRKVRLKLQETLRYHANWKHIKRTEHLFKELYRHVRGKAISNLTRRLLKIQSDEFIYGEIEFPSFYLILEKVKPQVGEIFYDLGSGSGKAVFAAALSFDFAKAYGIEFLPALYRKAQEQKVKCRNLIQSQHLAFQDVYLKKWAGIAFLNESFLETDFSDADIIYIAATCFEDKTWTALIKKLTTLKPGSRVIVTTKKIEHKAFELLNSSTELMSWGLCRVNIYRRS